MDLLAKLPATAPSRVTRGTLVGYGAAEAGMLAVELLLRIHILKYYTDTFGLAPDLAGTAMAFAVFWDAVTDPLMGRVSDRTRSRFGRRRPYLALGAPLLALATMLLVAPPSLGLTTDLGRAITLGLTAALVNTALTVIGVPHAAWAAELSDDSHQRTKLFASRLLWGNFGLLVGTMAPGLALQWMGDPKVGSLGYQRAYFVGAAIIAAVVVLSAVVTLLTTKEDPTRASLNASNRINDQRSLPGVYRNVAFARLLMAYSVATLGVGVNGTLSLFYYDLVLHLNTSGVNLVFGVFVLAWTVSVPAWVLVSRRWGKRQAGTVGVIGLGLTTASTYPFLPVGVLLYPVLIAVVTGLLTGSVVLLDAKVADLIDYDEALHGTRREGEFFGIWKFCGKAARALAIFFTGVALTNDLNSQATSSNPVAASSEAIAWTFGAGVGVLLMAGGLIFWTIPYGAKKHARVEAINKRRRIASSRTTSD